MSSGFTAGSLTSFVSILLFAASCASSGDDKKDAGTQKRYPSPTAVFDAYRKARDKRDVRTFFSLLTPRAQSDVVFESFFECMEVGSEEMGAIVPKYVDVATLDDDYDKQYKKKHGIDIAEVSAGHDNDPTFVPPPYDEQLWRDVVVAHVKNKAEFCEAVEKHFDKTAADRHEENPVFPLGDLEHLVVKGDTATGSAKETILPRGGESPRKPGQSPPVYEKPLKFQRVNGGWLLDSI
jgi:hypothetical protein